MASKYWLKMYHEALYDPKLASLPDNLWRRFWECCLMAGELDQGGFLPPFNSISWTCRTGEDTLRAEFGQLAQAGLLELKLDNEKQERWFVTNFSKRQAASDTAKRMREYRKRQKEEIDTDNRYILNSNASVTGVTKSNGDILQRTITAVSKICKETLWPKTEQSYQDAAYELIGRDATIEQIAEFGEWWKVNGWHKEKPVLKNILDSWEDFKTGKIKQSVAPNGNSQTKHDTASLLVELVKTHGRHGLRAKEQLGTDDWKIVEAMGGWANVHTMTEETIKIKYYQKRKEVAYV